MGRNKPFSNAHQQPLFPHLFVWPSSRADRLDCMLLVVDADTIPTKHSYARLSMRFRVDLILHDKRNRPCSIFIVVTRLIKADKMKFMLNLVPNAAYLQWLIVARACVCVCLAPSMCGNGGNRGIVGKDEKKNANQNRVLSIEIFYFEPK